MLLVYAFQPSQDKAAKSGLFKPLHLQKHRSKYPVRWDRRIQDGYLKNLLFSALSYLGKVFISILKPNKPKNEDTPFSKLETTTSYVFICFSLTHSLKSSYPTYMVEEHLWILRMSQHGSTDWLVTNF